MKHSIKRAASVFVLSASSLVGACGGKQSRAVSSVPPHHDAKLAQAVEWQLGLERELDRRGIQVTVKNGIATLRGQVGTFAEARRAARAAQLATGVRGVINLLHLEESGPKDSVLAARVKDALGAPEQPLQKLRITARAGNVRIDGVAPSLQRKRAAQEIAWSIHGVVGVDNRLRVVPIVRRSDAQIEADIRAHLLADGFAREDVRVGVDDGVVTLSGEVPSIFEERRALLRAGVAGVREVRDHLSVTQEREQYRRLQAGIRSALEIRAAILDAYRLDGRVPVRDVRVDVRSGVVTLTGQVSTAWQRFAAEQDAIDAAGAWIVENQLTLPGTLTPDERLERRVTERVEQHPYVSGERVEVEAERGHVTMSGHVLGAFQRDTAERVARLTPGVVSLENRLTVEQQPGAYPDDAETERRIAEKLRQSPGVDAASVRVTVRDGVATISGQAGNWQEYNEILEAVFAALPRRVVNGLEPPRQPALLRTW